MSEDEGPAKRAVTSCVFRCLKMGLAVGYSVYTAVILVEDFEVMNWVFVGFSSLFLLDLILNSIAHRWRYVSNLIPIITVTLIAAILALQFTET
jgi:putative AlgH/UPF0301 family transcriptional regulator